jgi:FdhD protein
MSLPTSHPVSRIAFRPRGAEAGSRTVPEETPIALSYNGSTHAVMMATPADLEDFAYGFTLTEDIVADAGAIVGVDLVEFEQGVDVQIELATDASEALARRRRRMAGPVGCGLCGIESIEQALRPASLVSAELSLSRAEVAGAAMQLAQMQPLNAQTRAVHAAGFYVPGKGVVLAREDVGRHNALDKLVGAIARAGMDGGAGAIVLTSRVSVEMVQKAAACGSPMVIAVSAPTALAIRMADLAGLTLIAVARGEEFEIFTHARRVATAGEPASAG